MVKSDKKIYIFRRTVMERKLSLNKKVDNHTKNVSSGDKKAKLPRGTHKKKLWIIIAVIFVLAAAVLIFSKSRKPIMNNISSITVDRGSVSNTVDGSGTLEAAESENIIVPTGLAVKKVYKQSGDIVKKGEKLAKISKLSIVSALLEVENNIDETEESLDYDDLGDLEREELQLKRSELRSKRAKLKKLYNSPYIKATVSGVIGEINIYEGQETVLSAKSSGQESSASALSTLYNGSAVSELSLNPENSYVIKQLPEIHEQTKESSDDDTDSEEKENTDNADTEDTGNQDKNDNDEQSINTINITSINITEPKAGAKPQKEIEASSQYTGTISWNPNDSVFKSNTSYTATVELHANKGYTFAGGNVPVVCGAKTVNTSVCGSGEQNKLIITVGYSETSSKNNAENSGKNSMQSENTGSYTPKISGSASAGNSGFTGSSASVKSSGSVSSGTGNASQTASVSGNSSVSYSENEMTAFTIQKQNKVKVVISADELDILSLKEGQKADVTIDAAGEDSFNGTITNISGNAESSGGSSKYNVDITINKTDDMLIGMSASVVITVDEVNDVLIIPMSALQEKNDSTFVYTQKDNSGNLSAEAEVETGLSDGSYVEIKNGLAQGDTIYYIRAESTENEESFDFGKFSEQGGFPPENGGNFGSDRSGNFPAGGPGQQMR